jgi:hypothetical protein
MYSVYQHWDPLKVCMVGKTYPPEFYSWIKNSKTRSIFERIATETEEDYRSLINILESFQVEVLRPDIPEDFSLLYNNLNKSYIIPPMTPRDYFGTYGNTLTYNRNTINKIYNNVKDESWPDVYSFNDLHNLNNDIKSELSNVFKIDFTGLIPSTKNLQNIFFGNILNYIKDECNIKITDGAIDTSTAANFRIGKDIYTNKNDAHNELSLLLNSYRLHNTELNYHIDGAFCPVVPGLIISLHDIIDYESMFPGWEVVYLPDQSWDKIKPFLDLKSKNKGKWWIPSEEYNDDVIEVVDTWLSKWVGYVEETVFDVNMLVINEQNVIVNNYNKLVFNALERHGVTPHICNFRHRYFWDGGLHCITSDLDREGEMKDYFPERKEVV